VCDGDAARRPPRNPEIPGPLWFELAERNASLAEFVAASVEAAFDRQPLAAARELSGGAAVLETTAWAGAEFPPRGASLGRGQLLILNAGLEFHPFAGENMVKGLLEAGLGLADLTGLSELSGPLAELGGALLEEIEPAPAKARPALRIAFVEIVEAAYHRIEERLDVATVVRQDRQGARTSYHFAGLGRAWPDLFMAARLDRELDWLRAGFLAEQLDIAAIEGAVIADAAARYGEADWPARKTELLERSAAIANTQLAVKGITAVTEAAALLRALAPRLADYRQVPAFIPRLDALAAAASGQGAALHIAADDAPRLFRAIGRAAPEGIVQSIAIAADGRRALRGDSDGWLRLWEIDTGRELGRWPADAQGMQSVWRVACAPDGRTALSAGEDAAVRLWDLADGRAIRRFEGHGGAVRGVAFSSDGRLALSGGLDGRVYVWKVATGRSIRRLVGLPQVRCVAFTPDGRLALTGDAWGQVGVCEVNSRRGVFYCRERHAGAVCDIAASPDGRLALSGGADGALRLWDIGRRRELRRFVGHTQAVLGVAFTPDGRRALSAGDDNTLRLWDVASGRELMRCAGPEAAPGAPHRACLTCVACLPDGRRALAGGSGRRRVVVWDRVSDRGE
jgi:hypothetical protein